jgi:hypothetical protein
MKEFIDKVTAFIADGKIKLALNEMYNLCELRVEINLKVLKGRQFGSGG